MLKKKTQGKSKWLLWAIFVIYAVELIWFFYSQIISRMVEGKPIDVKSEELAVALVLIGLVVFILFLLKKSNKIGRIVISVLVISIVLFCVIAPLFDVYIPIIWKIFGSA